LAAPGVSLVAGQAVHAEHAIEASNFDSGEDGCHGLGEGRPLHALRMFCLSKGL